MTAFFDRATISIEPSRPTASACTSPSRARSLRSFSATASLSAGTPGAVNARR
jgi:hypothetical protein